MDLASFPPDFSAPDDFDVAQGVSGWPLFSFPSSTRFDTPCHAGGPEVEVSIAQVGESLVVCLPDEEKKKKKKRKLHVLFHQCV